MLSITDHAGLQEKNNSMGKSFMDLYRTKGNHVWCSFSQLVLSSPSTSSHLTDKSAYKITPLKTLSGTCCTMKTNGSKLSWFSASANGSAEWNDEI